MSSSSDKRAIGGIAVMALLTLAVWVFAPSAKADTTAAAQVSAVESQGQSAVNSWEAQQQPGTAVAQYIAAKYQSDSMLATAMLANARLVDDDSAASAGGGPGTDPGNAAPSGPNPDLGNASIFSIRCHGWIHHSRNWTDWPTQIKLASVTAQVGDSSSGGWCYNGTYITSVAYWKFSKWASPLYCVEVNSTSHNGYGGSDSAGHTRWAHGGIWAQVGVGLTGACADWVAGAATIRIAGNGYYDWGY
jgi:hypothetical protein